MSRGLRKKLQNVHNWSDCTNFPRHFLPASYFLNNSLLIFLIPPGYNRKQEKLLSFFFIFLPLFFSENTPMRSGQPCRGIFMLSSLFTGTQWIFSYSPMLFMVYGHSSVYKSHKNTCPLPMDFQRNALLRNATLYY